MNPIRRELLNGLLVLVVASLLSVAFSAFQVSFNALLWVLILMGIAIAVSGYVVFEFVLSADQRERALAESMRRREEEWLKRVGNPARLELGMGAGSEGMRLVVEAIKDMGPGCDLTFMLYFGSGPGRERRVTNEAREQIYETIMEGLKRGTIREFRQVMCFDHDVLANDHELKSGIVRVGEGPGTIDRQMGKYCRMMMETKGSFLYLAPVVLRHVVGLYGTDKVSMTVETVDQDTGIRTFSGIMFFYDPPNGEIIEQFRQIERATERRMVAVHKIRFPEDAEPTAELATR